MGGWDGSIAALRAPREALNMALLMPEGERATREGLSRGLLDYYNSPGTLTAFRRKFESVTRREGEDPVTFAMELVILAVQGFGDMGPQARTRIVPRAVIWAVGNFGC